MSQQQMKTTRRSVLAKEIQKTTGITYTTHTYYTNFSINIKKNTLDMVMNLEIESARSTADSRFRIIATTYLETSLKRQI